MMQDTLIKLLDLYPPSSVKAEAWSLLREARGRTDKERSIRLATYDVLYAFQRLEAHRLGLRSDRQPHEYGAFRRSFVAALVMWVPGKDRLVDGIREAIAACAGGHLSELEVLLHQMLQSAEGQVQAGSSKRKMKTIDTYIRDALRDNPRLSEKALWRKIEQDSANLTDPRIGEIEHDGVWVIDPTPEGRARSQRLTRGSLRSRLSRIRGNLKSSQ